MANERDTELTAPNRTFESKLLFINEIFSDKYPQEIILQSAIQYKLSRSAQQYDFDVNFGARYLKSKENIQMLKKLNKIYKESL